MPIDGVVVKCMTSEFSRLLSGGRIKKINQPGRYEIDLDIGINRNDYRLLLSADPSLPRAYLTSEKKQNPLKAFSFCMLLRKHLSSGIIRQVRTVPYERVIFLDVSSRTELGEESNKTLVIEIMGKYSNIILIDENKRILDAVKHIDSSMSRLREIMPAREYQLPPPQDKSNIEDIDPAAFFLDRSDSGQSLKNYIISRVLGFSKRSVLELAGDRIDPDTPANMLKDDQVAQLILDLNKMRSMLASNIFSPCLIYKDSHKDELQDFYCLTLSGDEKRTYDKSISRIADAYYAKKSKQAYLRSFSSGLVRTVKNSLSRLDRKEDIHGAIIEDSANIGKYKHYGELITANMYRLKGTPQGDHIQLEDYSSEDNSMLSIPVDKDKTYQKNAAAYFKKASKAEKARVYSERELRKIRSERKYLESLLYHIENAEDKDELDQIKTELKTQGYIKDTNKKNKRKKDSDRHLDFRHFVTGDGKNVYVGRNNLQNDQLTLKYASSKDMWMHVKDYPGSHVILRYEGVPFTERDIIEGCMIAAYFSRARTSENVAVDHTPVKNVKRHSNKKPGMVYYVDYKTKFVTPDKRSIKIIRR